MMQAVTTNENLREGMELIAENHNLREEIERLRSELTNARAEAKMWEWMADKYQEESMDATYGVTLKQAMDQFERELNRREPISNEYGRPTFHKKRSRKWNQT